MISQRIAVKTLPIFSGAQNSLPKSSDVQAGYIGQTFRVKNFGSPNYVSYPYNDTITQDGFTLDFQAYILSNKGYTIFNGQLNQVEPNWLSWASYYKGGNLGVIASTLGIDGVDLYVAFCMGDYPIAPNSGVVSGAMQNVAYVRFPSVLLDTVLYSYTGFNSDGPLGIGVVYTDKIGGIPMAYYVARTGPATLDRFQIGQFAALGSGASVASVLFDGARYNSLIYQGAGSDYLLASWLPTPAGGSVDCNSQIITLSDAGDQSNFENAGPFAAFNRNGKLCFCAGVANVIYEFEPDYSGYTRYDLVGADASATSFLALPDFLYADYSRSDKGIIFTRGADNPMYYAISSEPAKMSLQLFPRALACQNYCLPLFRTEKD